MILDPDDRITGIHLIARLDNKDIRISHTILGKVWVEICGYIDDIVLVRNMKSPLTAGDPNASGVPHSTIEWMQHEDEIIKNAHILAIKKLKSWITNNNKPDRLPALDWITFIRILDLALWCDRRDW